jgi:hypothetical protein
VRWNCPGLPLMTNSTEWRKSILEPRRIGNRASALSGLDHVATRTRLKNAGNSVRAGCAGRLGTSRLEMRGVAEYRCGTQCHDGCCRKDHVLHHRMSHHRDMALLPRVENPRLSCMICASFEELADLLGRGKFSVTRLVRTQLRRLRTAQGRVGGGRRRPCYARQNGLPASYHTSARVRPMSFSM